MAKSFYPNFLPKGPIARRYPVTIGSQLIAEITTDDPTTPANLYDRGDHTHDWRYRTEGELSDTDPSDSGSRLIGVEASGGSYLTAANLKTNLESLEDGIEANDSDISDLETLTNKQSRTILNVGGSYYKQGTGTVVRLQGQRDVPATTRSLIYGPHIVHIPDEATTLRFRLKGYIDSLPGSNRLFDIELGSHELSIQPTATPDWHYVDFPVSSVGVGYQELEIYADNGSANQRTFYISDLIIHVHA